MSYGSDSSIAISVSGALTLDMINNAAQKAMDSGMQPDSMLVSPRAMRDIADWQKRERYWLSLGPLGYKMESLRWRLKHRAKHTVMNLPE